MPTSTFQRLNEKKKKRVFDATINEVLRHGVDQLQVASIVRESGIARGSFYQYFEDKQDVINYLLSEIGKEKMNFFSPHLNDTKATDLTFFDRISFIVKAGVDFALAHPRFQRVMKQIQYSKEDYLNKELLQSKEKARQLYLEWLINDVQKGRLQSDINITFVASVFVELMVQNLLSDLLSETLSETVVVDKIQNLIDIFRYGIEKRK